MTTQQNEELPITRMLEKKLEALNLYWEVYKNAEDIVDLPASKNAIVQIIPNVRTLEQAQQKKYNDMEARFNMIDSMTDSLESYRNKVREEERERIVGILDEMEKDWRYHESIWILNEMIERIQWS